MASKNGSRVAMLAALWALVAVGCGPTTVTIGGRGPQGLKATTVERAQERTRDRIVMIDVVGLLHSGQRRQLLNLGENPVSLLAEQLEAARNDRRVKAVVLRLNTPGGTVTASDVMYRQLERFKQETGKPVVALLSEVAASGGYYLACAADEIVAYPTSITGSIGVIFQTVSVKPALGRIGVQAEAFTSGPNKDAGSPLSDMTDEQRLVLQGLVDDFYARFVAVVREARPAIDPAQFDELTDGRVVSGRHAAEVGLADQAGDLQDAVAAAKRLAKITDANLVIYHRPATYVGSAYASTALGSAPGGTPGGASGSLAGGAGSVAPGGTQINLGQINVSEGLTGMGDGFYYLWDPAVQ